MHTPSPTGTTGVSAAPLAESPFLLNDRFRVIGRLGVGASGEVLHVYDEVLRTERALKVLASSLSGDEESRHRFLREARAMHAMQHPNIVRIFEVYENPDGQPFYAMELVASGSYQRRIESEGPLSPREACEVLIAVLGALQQIHSKGIVHRDIKPQNILCDPMGPKLGDFGIASDESEEFTITRTNVALGTRGYMAPEQEHGAARADARADLYAAGATLYALTTGRSPAELSSLRGREWLDRLPRALRRVVARAMEPEPERRFADAAAMRAALIRARDAIRPASWLGPGGLAVALGLAAWVSTRETPRPDAAVEPTTTQAPAGGSEPAPAEPPAAQDGRSMDAVAAEPERSTGPLAELDGSSEAVNRPAEEPAASHSPPAHAAPLPAVGPPQTRPQASPHAVGTRVEPTVEAAPSAEARAELIPARFNSTPWSEVEINGRSVGRTPLNTLWVPAGHYTVTLTCGPCEGKKVLEGEAAPGAPLNLCWDFPNNARCREVETTGAAPAEPEAL